MLCSKSAWVRPAVAVKLFNLSAATSFKTFNLQTLLTRFRSESSSIGLDFGTHSIKGVRLLRKPKSPRFTLTGAWVRDLPAGADSAVRVKTVQELLRQAGAEKSRVVTAVGGTGTVLRSVVIPKMTPEELRTALTFEAEKYIPFKLAEVYLDSTILQEQPGGRMEVLLAAARREVVKSHLDLLGSGGLVPFALDLEAVALANAWEISHPESAEKISGGLLQVGARGTLLNFFTGTQLQFSREIPLGGESFAKSAAQPKDAWEEWLSQCRVSFDFFENQFGHRVEELYLTGGAAQTAGFPEWVQESSGLPTRLWDPLSGLDRDPSVRLEGVAAGRLGVAVGLAARGLVS